MWVVNCGSRLATPSTGGRWGFDPFTPGAPPSCEADVFTAMGWLDDEKMRGEQAVNHCQSLSKTKYYISFLSSSSFSASVCLFFPFKRTCSVCWQRWKHSRSACLQSKLILWRCCDGMRLRHLRVGIRRMWTRWLLLHVAPHIDMLNVFMVS